MITQPGILQPPQPTLHEFANFIRVIDPAKPRGVKILMQIVSVAGAAASASSRGVHAKISNA
jgi:hypothetical protein